MSDELPAAALKAGAEALLGHGAYAGLTAAGRMGLSEEDARAVLVAATERIECPHCEVWGAVTSECPVCRGSGFLFVLRRSAIGPSVGTRP